MADAQRGQFVIDCKSGEAAGIIYGLVHDKTMFRPELDLANAHPKEFDNEHIFPLDMFINSDYMLKLSKEEFANAYRTVGHTGSNACLTSCKTQQLRLLCSGG